MQPTNSEVPHQTPSTIELNFLRITASPEDFATVTAMMEKMGWMNAAHPIQVLAPPPTQAGPTSTPVEVPCTPCTGDIQTTSAKVEPESTPSGNEASGSTTPAPDPTPLTKPFSVLAKRHIENMSRNPKTKKGSTKDATRALTVFLQVMGDRSVEAIGPDDIGYFTNILAWWPKGGTKKPIFDKKSPAEIAQYVKKNKLEKLKLTTQSKHLLYIDAFFNWLIRSKDISENPMRYLDMGRYQEERIKKPAMPKSDVLKIFDFERISLLRKPLEYWGPLFALYQGMRCTEIAQLMVDNIIDVELTDEDGVMQVIPCIDITDSEEGQSVKSRNSRRLLPIHSKLLLAGFLEYVRDIRKYGSKELFPGVSWTDAGPGHGFSAWFNGEYMRKECGVTTPRVTLHCFRHHLNTLSDRNRVPHAVLVTINGHADGSSVTEKHYIARADVLECQHYLEKLPFPEIKLPLYTSERFKPFLAELKAKKESLARRIKEGKPLPARRGPKPVEDPFSTDIWKGALEKAGDGKAKPLVE